MEDIKNKLRIIRDYLSLLKADRIHPDISLLLSKEPDFRLSDIFQNEAFRLDWENIYAEISKLELPENTGGVNIGDQKALASLIYFFKPKRILEIGTHIGCSTVHIAICLRELFKRDDIKRRVDTVDLIDVNDQNRKHWLNFYSSNSPLENIKSLQAESLANFIHKPSLDFLKTASERYDFIFLDGSHEAKTVYKELPLALKILNKNGVILLHDYFPRNKPLWEDGVLISGPYMAVAKLQKDEPQLAVVPLGELPWETKRNSKITSLALVMRKDS